MTASPFRLIASLALASAFSAPVAAEEIRVTYLCSRGIIMDVAFDGASATLTYEGSSVALTQEPTGSGFLYAGGGHVLRGKEHEAMWTDAAGAERDCVDQEWSMRQPQVEPTVPTLAGTRWRLVHFQSSDDAIGTVIPPRVERYTMEFRPDGGLALQLDCNRGNGRWESNVATSQGGSLSLRGGAMTRAACGPDALDTRIAADLSRVRSYVMTEGRLAIALEADAGIYLWEPVSRQ